jgi:hypothetical protein
MENIQQFPISFRNIGFPQCDLKSNPSIANIQSVDEIPANRFNIRILLRCRSVVFKKTTPSAVTGVDYTGAIQVRVKGVLISA